MGQGVELVFGEKEMLRNTIYSCTLCLHTRVLWAIGTLMETVGSSLCPAQGLKMAMEGRGV